MTPYQEIIRETAAQLGHLGIDPRHVMAWLLLEHGTLDHLGHDDFARGVTTFAASGMTPAEADELAQSFGI